jgi:hypothetical protein
MRGQVVVCKDVDGNPLVRKVWDHSATAVFIHDDEEWEKRMRGERHLEPVGFPARDVFTAADLSLLSTPINWAALQPYSDSKAGSTLVR